MLDNLITIFQDELHKKLSLKARTTTSEMNLLFNAFKFYDIDDNGTIKRENWSRVFNRIGLNIFSEPELNEIFNIFDTNSTGVINYRNFIQNIFDWTPSNYQNDNYNLNTNFNINNNNINNINNNNNIDSNVQSYNIKVNTPMKPDLQNNIPTQIPLNENDKLKPITPLNNNNNSINNDNIMNNNINNNIIKEESIKNPDSQIETSNKESININNNSGMNKYFQNLLELFQNKININNGLTYYILVSKLNEKEDKISKTISYENFYSSIKESKINLSENEIKDFFILLDISEQNKILTEEFLRLLRGFLSERRKMIIIEKFAKIDINREGYTEVNLIKSIFNPHLHPEVLMNKKSENEIFEEFIFMLDTYLSFKGKINDNIITFEDFIEFYSAISASIDNEDYFIDMMNNVWSSATNYYNINRNNSQNQFSEQKINQRINTPVQNIKSPQIQINRPQSYNPIIRNPPKYNIISGRFDYRNQLSQNQINNINLSQSQFENNNKDIIHNKQYSETITKKNFGPNNLFTTITTTTVNNNTNNNNFHSYKTIDNYNTYNRINNNNITISNLLNQNKTINNSIYKISENQFQIKNNSNDPFPKLRSMLISRGPKSLFVIEKMISMYDTSHTGIIDFQTFEKIITFYRLSLSHDEILSIFDLFDHNKQGKINYDDFIKGLIGNLSPRRDYLIKRIFNVISNGKNELSINDIKNNYNTLRDPEWVARKKTKEEVINDFMDNLNIFLEYNSHMSKANSGFMNFDDFYKFYSQISMGISDDNYFEYLVNNVWNLDGGSANNYYNYGQNAFEQRGRNVHSSY